MTSKHSFSEVSDESDDSEYYSLGSDMENSDDYLTSDASHAETFIEFNKHLDIEDVRIIDKSLDLYDKVSLIYLLYNEPHIALQQIIVLFHNSELNIIEAWYHNEKKINEKWQSKLLEALTIIQNYEILRKIGFRKDDMIINYMPLQDVTLNINIVRKYCYRVCENFGRLETDSFLEHIKKDLERNNMDYISYDPEHLEMYFLYLEQEKYIARNNIHNLAKVFKYMGEDNLHDKFESLHDKINRTNADYNVDKTPGNRKSNSLSNDLELTNKVEENVNESKNDIYDVDQNCPGVLLIINNEDFYTELRDEYRHLLPKTDLKLESRTGSQADEIKLRETFTKLGFEIITKQNKIHEDMIAEIRNVVDNFTHSCLFVAILSHGDQGIVYAANSIAVDVANIQRAICHKHLSGKPKVLLLQSCQGSDCQKLDADEYETDGPPKKYIQPKTTDLLTFRATIPGYGAVRHRREGSWFIQDFCKTIEDNTTCHIEEICTKVINKVSRKVWGGNKCMVPLKESTFTKSLYLKMVK